MRPVILALLLALAAPTASAATLEIPVFLHEYTGGLHLAPEQVNADVGDTVRFIVTNTGLSPHNFMVCGDGEKLPETCDDRWAFTGMIPSNGTATATVESIPEAGRFDYFCYVAGHKGAGMKGTLVVQGADQESAIPGLGSLGVGASLVLAAGLAIALRRRSG